MDRWRGARFSWRCSRHTYRARGGQKRHLAGGKGEDATATMSCIRARILTSSDRLGRERYREGFWKLLRRPRPSLSPTVRWPGSSSALSSPEKKKETMTCLARILKRAETVSGLFRLWAGLATWAAVACFGPTGKLLSLFSFLFYFLFSICDLNSNFDSGFALQVQKYLNIKII